MPTVCVTSPTVCTIGVIAVLIGWVICCTGAEASELPSVTPPAFRAPAVVERTVASGVVSGDSGARLPVPSPPTVVLRPCTTPLVELTTEPSPATVVPTGLAVVPICPTPPLTALASEFSVLLVLDTVLPRPCVTCGLRPGMVCEAIVLPRSLVVCAAAVAMPVVPDDVLVGGPPLVEPRRRRPAGGCARWRSDAIAATRGEQAGGRHGDQRSAQRRHGRARRMESKKTLAGHRCSSVSSKCRVRVCVRRCNGCLSGAAHSARFRQSRDTAGGPRSGYRSLRFFRRCCLLLRQAAEQPA